MREISRFVSVLALFISILALLLAYGLIPSWLVVVLLLPLPIAVVVICIRMLGSFFRPLPRPAPTNERSEGEA